jgi:hypothetical protein
MKLAKSYIYILLFIFYKYRLMIDLLFGEVYIMAVLFFKKQKLLIKINFFFMWLKNKKSETVKLAS